MRMCNCANFFKGMRKDVLRVFALDTRVEVFNSHEEIFAIGDAADRIYFVEKGEVLIS
jgi:CRP-like cAMP-binding protein